MSSSGSGAATRAEASAVAPMPSATTLPTVVLCVGMAGSGKTSLVSRLHAHCSMTGLPAYFINLDPAVKSVPYTANIDIRDTIDYKNVMKEYGLGPNGAIVTSLNLFSTKFDQVLKLLQERAPEIK